MMASTHHPCLQCRLCLLEFRALVCAPILLTCSTLKGNLSCVRMPCLTFTYICCLKRVTLSSTVNVYTAVNACYCAGREPKKWTASSVPTPSMPPCALPLSTITTPEQRQDDALTRFNQVQDDPKAVEVLLKEITGNLLAAERLISHLQAGRRLAQHGRDTTKATMVATNSNLLKVRSSDGCCGLCLLVQGWAELESLCDY
jgi:hypothetical protein